MASVRPSTLHRGASICALAGLLVFSVPSTGSAGRERHRLPAFGSQFHATWTDYSDAERELALRQLRRAGATWVRIDVGWETLEPRRQGAFQAWYLDVLDHGVEAARHQGMSIILTLFATPKWASRNGEATAPPKDASDYGEVLERLARRYKGDVDAYEVWNEPNSEAFFSGSPRDYVALLEAARDAIAAADPESKVVGGSTQYNDDEFLDAVYEAGGRGTFDVWSTHPYMGKADAPPEMPDDGSIWTIDHVREIRAALDAHGDEDVPVWFTEFGWSSHPTGKDAPEWRRGVTGSQQANYLVRALCFVAVEHPSVDVMVWYTERNKRTGDIHEDGYGLMTRDLQPKPVYRAAKRLLVKTTRPEC